MTALARSIGTQDTVLYLSSSLDVGSVPAPFLIDAECVLVTGGDMQSQVFVSRAQFGTAAATHDVGTDLVSGWGSTNGPVTLAQVLANGNDTGGIGIVSNATGSDTADASTGATSVDGEADISDSATASGDGDADGRRIVTTQGAGDAYAIMQAIATGTGTAEASITGDSFNANGIANVNAYSGGVGHAAAITIADAQAHGSSGNAFADRNALADTGIASATTNATSNSGTASADITSSSSASNATVSATVVPAFNIAVAGLAITDESSRTASLAVKATATGPQLQVNDLPLITTGSGAPGATFVSLFYVDTTLVTGGGYCWDFVSGAYVKIGTV